MQVQLVLNHSKLQFGRLFFYEIHLKISVV